MSVESATPDIEQWLKRHPEDRKTERETERERERARESRGIGRGMPRDGSGTPREALFFSLSHTLSLSRSLSLPSNGFQGLY
jgi:hypothetical protein